MEVRFYASYRVQSVDEGPFRELLQGRHVNGRVLWAGSVIIGGDRCRHWKPSNGGQNFECLGGSVAAAWSNDGLDHTQQGSFACPPRRLPRSAVEYLDWHYMAEALSMSLRECLSRLQRPVHDLQTLTNLLASSLAAYDVLPPRHQHFVETSVSLSRDKKAVRLIPQFQFALLEQVLPNWEQTLEENDLMPLVQQWFCPVNSSSEYAAGVARHALSSILGVPLRQYTVAILERLLYHYPLSSIYCHFFPVSGGLFTLAIDWDEYLKDIFSLSTKVANASSLGGIQTPEQLGTRFAAPFYS
jgi:hypothetical protein